MAGRFQCACSRLAVVGANCGQKADSTIGKPTMELDDLEDIRLEDLRWEDLRKTYDGADDGYEK